MTGSPMGESTTAPAVGLHEAIDELAAFNARPDLGGLTREVYTPEYQQALAYVAARAQACGLATRVDEAGNVIATLHGSEPGLARVITGSHFDTTLNAGRYDGVVGVLGGIAAVARIAAGGRRPRRTIEVIGFAGEEPRFGMGCIGSRLMTGRLGRADLDVLRDRDGVTVAQALAQFGLDPDRAPDARVDLSDIHAVLELHVEQGGRLEDEGAVLGVVTRIAAAHDLRVQITGRAVHSGATPMHLRHDALLGAAEVALAVERAAQRSPSGTTVGTVGALTVSPGALNVVPGAVSMLVDIRDSDAGARAGAVAEFRAAIDEVARRRGLTYTVEVIQDNTPSACAPLVVDAVRAACEANGAATIEMQSGAYHDCMSFAPEVPIGMVFVPSAGGISHSPDEYTARADIDRGVDVLAGALRRLAA